ncbi:UNVERIFIED_CONTAM: hypothetical protein K2H54_002180 [Gekko kuhli]
MEPLVEGSPVWEDGRVVEGAGRSEVCGAQSLSILVAFWMHPLTLSATDDVLTVVARTGKPEAKGGGSRRPDPTDSEPAAEDEGVIPAGETFDTDATAQDGAPPARGENEGSYVSPDWELNDAFGTEQQADPTLESTRRLLAVSDETMLDPRWASRYPRIERREGVW